MRFLRSSSQNSVLKTNDADGIAEQKQEEQKPQPKSRKRRNSSTNNFITSDVKNNLSDTLVSSLSPNDKNKSKKLKVCIDTSCSGKISNIEDDGVLEHQTGKSFISCSHVNTSIVFGVKCGLSERISDPSSWNCDTCHITEDLWVCLFCGFMGCGRDFDKHSIEHFKSNPNHCLALDFNTNMVHCYKCDEWVIDDNMDKEVELIRKTVQGVKDQKIEEEVTPAKVKFGAALKAVQVVVKASKISNEKKIQMDMEDKIYTALQHWRLSLKSRVFNSLLENYYQAKDVKLEDIPEEGLDISNQSAVSLGMSRQTMEPGEKRRSRRTVSSASLGSLLEQSSIPKRHPLAGRTGLRNLGNTCYLNSILQCCAHLHHFKDFFLNFDSRKRIAASSTSDRRNSIGSESSLPGIQLNVMRQTTQLCYEAVSRKIKDSVPIEEMSLVQELHNLMRVMWSGKWAVCTPYALLFSIWRYIPQFKGYQQQDAQEFCNAFLDCLDTDVKSIIGENKHDIFVNKERNFIEETFVGVTCNQIKCLNCNTISKREENFLCLSLDIPLKYQGKSYCFPKLKMGKRINTAEAEKHAKMTIPPTPTGKVKDGTASIKLNKTLKKGSFSSAENKKKKKSSAKTADLENKKLENPAIKEASKATTKKTTKKATKGRSKKTTKEEKASSTKTKTAKSKTPPVKVKKNIKVQIKKTVNSENISKSTTMNNGRRTSKSTTASKIKSDDKRNDNRNKKSKPTLINIRSSRRLKGGTGGDMEETKGKGKGRRRTRSSSFNGDMGISSCSLYDCLAGFTDVETLKDDYQYFCEHCDAKHDAEKGFKLGKLPKILVFHINRAKWLPHGGRVKLMDHVNFPMENLNMDQFFVPEELEKFREDHDLTNAIYDLSGIINHHGKGIDKGHYTCYCRDSLGETSAWLLFNDMQVSVASSKDVNLSQAYLLVYELRESEKGPGVSTPILKAKEAQIEKLKELIKENPFSL